MWKSYLVAREHNLPLIEVLSWPLPTLNFYAEAAERYHKEQEHAQRRANARARARRNLD